MLRIHTNQRLDQIAMGLRAAVERHGGSLLSRSDVADGAISFTLCFKDLYAPLLRSDLRFAAFLPARVAACAAPDGVSLEALAPRECCRMLHRPELFQFAAALEDTLRFVMEEAAQHVAAHSSAAVAEHGATEDQINMRAALPQRIDCHGTKVEEMAGTGVHDAQGG